MDLRAFNRELSNAGASTSAASSVCRRSHSARPRRLPRLVQQIHWLDVEQPASPTALPAAMQPPPFLRSSSMDWRKECYSDKDDEAFLELSAEEVRWPRSICRPLLSIG